MSFDTSTYTKSPYIKGDDLPEGEKVVVTIKSAEEVTFPQSGDTVPVLEFLELDQKLTLNRTRVAKLVELFGEETDEWIGQRIALFSIPVSYKGQSSMSVAIGKAPARATKTRAQVEDDITFEQPAKRKAQPVAIVVEDDDIPF